MKQHITVEQMKEVEDTVLAEALNSNKFNARLENVNMERDFGTRETLIGSLASFVTIGKMIEVLKDNGVDYVSICSYNIGGEDRELVQISGIDFWADNICDALWEAVKYVLEVEDE